MVVESDCCYVWIFEYAEWVNRRLYHIGCCNVAFDILLVEVNGIILNVARRNAGFSIGFDGITKMPIKVL